MSTAGENLTIAVPWANAVIRDSGGNTIGTSTCHAPNYPDFVTYTFPTRTDETYIFYKK